MNIAKKIEDFFTNVSDDRLEELLARADFDKYNSICSDVLPPLATPLITPVMQGWQQGSVSADTYLGTDVFFTADLVAPIVIGTKDIHFSIGVSLGNLFSDSVKGQRVLAGNTEDMPLAA